MQLAGSQTNSGDKQSQGQYGEMDPFELIATADDMGGDDEDIEDDREDQEHQEKVNSLI